MSKINDIKMLLRSILTSFNSVSTDKGAVVYEGDELEVGASVHGVDEEGNEIPLEDGNYVAENGDTIVIADGKVTDIIKPEDKPAEESEEKEQFSSKKLEFEESYNDIFRAIQEALNAAGFDAYVVDAGDGFAIVDVWEGDHSALYRYNVTLNEDGTVTLGEREEVKEAYVPKNEEPKAEEPKEDENMAMAEEEEPKEDEKDAKIAELQAAIEEKDAKIAELEAEIEKLKNEPAAKPAQEEFKQANRVYSSDDEKMNNLMRIVNAK